MNTQGKKMSVAFESQNSLFSVACELKGKKIRMEKEKGILLSVLKK